METAATLEFAGALAIGMTLGCDDDCPQHTRQRSATRRMRARRYTGLMRKAIAAALAITFFAEAARADCTTESPEAIALANEGDKLASVNLDGAIEKYEKAFDVAKASPHIASKLAAAYEKKEDWPRAIAVLAKAAELDPADASLARRLGRARANTPALTEARAALAHAVRLDPHWAEAHFDLGDVMWRLGDEQGALEHLTNAVRFGPSVAAHWAALADAYRRLGLMTQASKVIAEAPKFVKQDDFDLARVAGRIHERAGENDAAVASYESAKRACGQCGGSQAVIFFELGRTLLGAKRMQEASANVQTFYKVVCKGAGAMRFADECMQAQAMLRP